MRLSLKPLWPGPTLFFLFAFFLAYFFRFVVFFSYSCSSFYLYIADTFSSGGRKAVASDAKEAIKNSKEYAQKILTTFVDQTGQKLTLFIRTFVETRNWMSKKEPRKVSDVWKDMATDLSAIQRICEQLFPDESKPKSGSGSYSFFFSQKTPRCNETRTSFCLRIEPHWGSS